MESTKSPVEGNSPSEMRKSPVLVAEEIIKITTSPKTANNLLFNRGAKTCFYLNSIESPILRLKQGKTYQLNLEKLETPFYFSTDPLGKSKIVGPLTEGQHSLTVDSKWPKCTYYGSSMGNKVLIEPETEFLTFTRTGSLKLKDIVDVCQARNKLYLFNQNGSVYEIDKITTSRPEPTFVLNDVKVKQAHVLDDFMLMLIEDSEGFQLLKLNEDAVSLAEWPKGKEITMHCDDSSLTCYFLSSDSIEKLDLKAGSKGNGLTLLSSHQIKTPIAIVKAPSNKIWILHSNSPATNSETGSASRSDQNYLFIEENCGPGVYNTIYKCLITGNKVIPCGFWNQKYVFGFPDGRIQAINNTGKEWKLDWTTKLPHPIKFLTTKRLAILATEGEYHLYNAE